MTYHDDENIRNVDIEDTDSIKFEPPVSLQRYNAVCNLLQNDGIQTVKTTVSIADFGINTCRVLKYYKSIHSIEKIYGVDIDRGALESGMFLAKPLISDHIAPNRSSPLEITLLCGSVGEFDSRLQGVDAVVMIELIEHLPDETLSSFPSVVFGSLRPKLVVITTPNADFNVLFPNFCGKRHWDHKFEWTRNEFRHWCEEVAQRYGYTVDYTGVGDSPSQSSHLGHCSQIAVFRRNESRLETQVSTTELPYDLVFEAEHPYCKSSQPDSEKLLLEAKYYLCQAARHLNEEVSDDEDSDPSQTHTLKLEWLMMCSGIKHICTCTDLLRQVLKAGGYELTPDEQEVYYTREDGSQSDAEETEDYMSDRESCNEQPKQDIGERLQFLSTEPISSNSCTQEENWDEPPEETPPEFEDSSHDYSDLINNLHHASCGAGLPKSKMIFIPSFEHAHQGPYSHRGSSFLARTQNSKYIVESQFSDVDEPT